MNMVPAAIPKVYCADTRHSANVLVKIRVKVSLGVGLGSALKLGLGLVGIVDFWNSEPSKEWTRITG